MTSPSLCARVLVDWVGDGLYASPVSDVTRDTAGDPGLVIDTGRDGARALSPPKVPSATFELRNDHGRYSNESGASPVYQLVRPGTPVRMTAAYGATRPYRASSPYRADAPYRGRASWTLGTTRIDQATQDASRGHERVRIATLGFSSVLVGRPVTVPLHIAILTHQAVELVLDAAGWPPDKRAISPGDTLLSYWWADGRAAWDLLQELTASEGPATMYEDADGVFHWEGRNYRAVTERSTTPQAAFFDTRATGGRPYRSGAPYRDDRLYRGSEDALYVTALAYEPGWRTTYARATYSTKRRAYAALGVIWQYGADIVLGSGASRTLFARPGDPFVNAEPPALGVDYALVSGAATIALDATSGFLGIITITAGAGGCRITGPPADPATGLRLRDHRLRAQSETVAQSSVDPSDSAAAYGAVQTLAVAGWPELDPAMAEGVCDAWVARYAVPRPQVTLSVVAVDADHFRQIVERDVSDRISLRSVATGLATDVWIESREIVVSGAGGRRVEAVWRCEQVDAVTGFVWDGAASLWDSALWGR